jgi:SAM-dependent methyltransferase
VGVRILALVLLLLSPGCVYLGGGVVLPGQAPTPAAPAPEAEAPGEAPNRDRHGPGDVERYIEALQREKRVRALDPEGVIRTLAIAEDAVVADVGSGPGVLTVPLARHLTKGLVYAVDVEPRQLDALRGHLLAEGIDNVVPVLASYSDPHLPPGGVDWILVVDTYHHFDDRVSYLRGLRDDLAPGGRLAILEYEPGPLPVGPPEHRKVPLETRLGELREAGFVLVESFDTHRYRDFEVWRPQGAP